MNPEALAALKKLYKQLKTNPKPIIIRLRQDLVFQRGLARMSISDVAVKTEIPPEEIEAQELGLKPFDTHIFGRLSLFYSHKNRRIKITEEDFESLDENEKQIYISEHSVVY